MKVLLANDLINFLEGISNNSLPGGFAGFLRLSGGPPTKLVNPEEFERSNGGMKLTKNIVT